LMLRFFLSGLRPQIRNVVLMRNPSTFEEALNQAQYSEGCEALTTRTTARTFVINSERYSGDKGEIECYFCHRLGHIRRNCNKYYDFLRQSGGGSDRPKLNGNFGSNKGPYNLQRPSYLPERNGYQNRSGGSQDRHDYENNRGDRRSYRDVLAGVPKANTS